MRLPFTTFTINNVFRSQNPSPLARGFFIVYYANREQYKLLENADISVLFCKNSLVVQKVQLRSFFPKIIETLDVFVKEQDHSSYYSRLAYTCHSEEHSPYVIARRCVRRNAVAISRKGHLVIPSVACLSSLLCHSEEPQRGDVRIPWEGTLSNCRLCGSTFSFLPQKNARVFRAFYAFDLIICCRLKGARGILLSFLPWGW